MDTPATNPRRPDDADILTLSGILRALLSHEVDFVVCGGVACIMHGVSRVTADLDIAVRMDEQNLARLVGAIRRLGMQPRIPEPLEALLDPEKRREWVERKNALAYTLVSQQHPMQIDVFLKYPIPFNELKSEANVMAGRDVTVHVSSRPHLILAKRAAGREQDLNDIRDLERLMRDEQRSRPQT